MTANPDTLAREIVQLVREASDLNQVFVADEHFCRSHVTATVTVAELVRTFADEKVKEERAECAKIAERLATGVAIQIGQDLFVLGGMTSNPVDAQRATATAIAAVLRSREGGR